FRKTDMRAGLASIVVRVDKVDAETFQALQGFARALVGRRPGAKLGIIQRHGGEVDACAVQVEVFAVDPEFAKAETHGVVDIPDVAARSLEGNVGSPHVRGRVDVP